MRNMKLSSNNISATFSMSGNGADARFFDNIITYSGELDYEKLKNKPRLGGRELIGDVDELDPQVPAWAKEEETPVEPIPTDVVESWFNTEPTPEPTPDPNEEPNEEEPSEENNG